MNDFETVAIYLEPSEAVVARSYLEAHGFFVIVPDFHHATMNWWMTFALQGVRVMTLAGDTADAKAVLAEIPAYDPPYQPPLAAQATAGIVALLLNDIIRITLPIARRWPRLFQSKNAAKPSR